MISTLKFDNNSVKIFKYLFETEKNIKLYGITGDDDSKIDTVIKTLMPFTQFDPMHNNALLHNTCDNYFNKFLSTGYTYCDFEDGKMINKINTIVLLYPETGMNIREQQKFVNMLIEKLLSIDIEQNEFEIVIVTHSLLILSDIPSGNVNVFNTEICKSANGNFFGGNIIDILANLSPDIMTGRLSSIFSSKLVQLANDYHYDNCKEKPNNELIDFIGDDMIKGYIKNRIALKIFNNI